MRYEITETVQKATVDGLAPATGTATVKDLLGVNLTVYAAETGAGTLTNPLTIDSAGRIEGWVEAPDFDLVISGSGFTSYTQKIRTTAPGRVSVQSYGAKVDGTTNDTTAVNAAVDAAFAAGGGDVFFPSGTCRANVVIKPRVRLVGSSSRASIIKSVANANTDVIKGLNFDTLTGKAKATGDYALGAYEVEFKDITIDGDKANQSAGWGIRIWGRSPKFKGVVNVRSCKSGGIWNEFTEVDSFADPVQVLEGHAEDVSIHDCDGHGWVHRGPHDFTVMRCVQWQNTGWAVRVESSTSPDGFLGLAWNGGVSFRHLNFFLCGNGIYYDGTDFQMHGGQITGDSGTGFESTARTGGAKIRGVMVAGHVDGIILRGASHTVHAQCDRMTSDAVVLDGCTGCHIDIYGSANNNVINNISETGPNSIRALFDVPSAKTLTAGAGLNSGGQYMMRGFGAGGNSYVQQFPSTTLKAGGWSPVLPASNGIMAVADYTNVASAGTIALPGDQSVLLVTGTTNITSVTIKPAGYRVTLIFSGVLTFTDGSNLKLSANLVTTADDTITLVSDGTNWYEVARSVN